jgi:GWxTD domain-containing protein
MTSPSKRTFLVLVVMASLAVAQPGRRSPSAQPLLSSVAFEAIPLFTTDTSSAIVQIHYRIRQDFFIILRNTDPGSGASYIGKGELVVELKDENNNSAAREFRTIVIRRNAPRSDNDQPADIQGAFTLRVPSGTYTVWLSLDDAQSERSFVNHDQTVKARKPSTMGLEVSSPVFAVPSPNMDARTAYDVLNHGTATFFGEKGGYLFNVFLPSDTSLTLKYQLSNRTEHKVLAQQEFHGDSILVTEGVAMLQRQSGDESFASTFPIRYVRSEASRGWNLVYVPLPLEKLFPGEATITMDFKSGSSVRHVEFKFKTFWARRPLSLSNLDFAVEALQHIASEEEMEEFHTLSDARLVVAFYNFWKKRDRDTATAYNELMTEYYSRVDIANQRYSSNREVDGYKSDQGRIFILYGTPTNTERLFSPSGPPREVWTYAQLKKRFIFEDERRSGVYILTNVEDL